MIVLAHALHCIALRCVALPCLALPCLALPCIALYGILHRIALHWDVGQPWSRIVVVLPIPSQTHPHFQFHPTLRRFGFTSGPLDIKRTRRDAP